MPLHIIKDVKGQQTELLMQQFADRTLVLVSQMGKVGTLIQATIPPTTPFSPQSSKDVDGRAALPEPPVSIVLTPLMGTSPSADHKTIFDIYASQIATIIWSSSSVYRSPVVVGLAIRKQPPSTEEDDATMEEGNRDVFFEIMDMVNEALKQIEFQLP